jgi:hypothetical protein
MAEQIDLSINIGANTQNLQAEIQKAQNLLGQFQSALKKATNVGEINYLNTAIGNLQQKIAGLNSQMGNMRKPTADATNALTNLSRVAQDAPYGFMGIANNLNPMLESFQRLQKESGSTGNALKALVGGLSGPAGIGVALGVASSLIVAFGKDISDFFSKLTSGNESLAKSNNAFHEAKQAYIDAYVEIQNLGNAFESFHNGTMSKKQVLDKYNETLGKVYGTTKDINEAESIYLTNSPKYIQAATYRAAAQIALTKAAEQSFKQQEAIFNPKAFGGFDLNQFIAAAGLSKLVGANVSTMNEALGSANAIKKGKEQENIFLQIADAFNKMVQETNSSAQKSVLFGKELDKKDKADDPFKEYLQNLKSENNAILQAIQKRKELLKEIGSPILMQTPEDKAKAEKQRLAGIKLFGESKMTGEFGESLKGKTSAFYEEQRKINEEKAKEILLTQQQTDANLQLADTLSNYTTNAFMNLFNSMEQGMSLGESLGNMFLDLAKQIAAAALKALAFQAILSLIPGGAGAKVASGGFGGIFKSILGLASGGVVTGPTLAMIGEGQESEAVMPLSKLGNLMQSTFNAGAMASNGGNGNGEFVLRGQDLVLALNRSETSLKYRRG